MNSDSCQARFASGAAITIPVVCSTRRYASSRLCAAIGMAIAYARGDRRGDSYRDLLELCLRDDADSIEMVLETTRRLFPDIPVSDYGPEEMELDDVLLLARQAAQRNGRLLPVLVYDERFHPEVARNGLHTIVLNRFAPDDPTVRSFWDAEPAQLGGWRMSSRVELVPAGFQTLVFGWLPPSADSARNLRLLR